MRVSPSGNGAQWICYDGASVPCPPLVGCGLRLGPDTPRRLLDGAKGDGAQVGVVVTVCSWSRAVTCIAGDVGPDPRPGARTPWAQGHSASLGLFPRPQRPNGSGGEGGRVW